MVAANSNFNTFGLNVIVHLNFKGQSVNSAFTGPAIARSHGDLRGEQRLRQLRAELRLPGLVRLLRVHRQLAVRSVTFPVNQQILVLASMLDE